MNLPPSPTDREPTGEARFQELLARSRAGDHEAIGLLVDQFRFVLLDLVNRKLDDDLRAKIGCSDIVQETMLTAQKCFDQFAGSDRDAFLAWLYEIVRHDMLETVRRFKMSAKRDVARESPLADSAGNTPVADSVTTPLGGIVAAEQAAALHAALARLKPEYQQVIQLRNWQQLPFAEIGSTMQLSSEAARKLWSRALAALQAEMGDFSFVPDDKRRP